MILVTGATGHVGSELVAQLASLPDSDLATIPDTARSIRAMTRRPRATSVPPTVEVVYGDADDRSSLDAAFAGVDAAFLMSAQPVGSAPRPTHDIALAAAAERAGVSHAGARRWRQRRPDRGVASAGRGGGHRWRVRWTLLRPGRFAPTHCSGCR